MELQIQDLVTSIRREGIEAANAEAEAIIAEAQKKAEGIVAAARAEAQEMKDSAEKEIHVLKESAAVGAEQAKRDAMLAFRASVQEEYQKLLSSGISANMKSEALGKLIRAALAGEDVSAYTAEVAEVGDALKAELAEEIRNGLELKPVKNIRAGFRLAEKDGSGYFDCTEEEIMQMLMPFFRNLDF